LLRIVQGWFVCVQAGIALDVNLLRYAR